MSPIARYLSGHLSAEMTALELICDTEDVDAACAVVTAAKAAESGDAARKLGALGALLALHREGCRRIATMLREGTDTGKRFEDPARGIQFARELFDASVAKDEVLSVAMWSLGDRGILERATTEVVAWACTAVPIRSTDRVLDLGCGTGRYVHAFADVAAHVTGLDVSPRMIDVARNASPANVEWVVGSGRELPFADEAFDVVLAIDSFPYVHQGGDALVREVAREVRRVLAPGGRFAILNVAYGDDPVRDARIVAWLEKENDFVIAVSAACPSKIWTVPAWVLRARPRSSDGRPSGYATP